MSAQYWLVKQEPESYPWSRFCTDGGAAWTGIRNYQARNYLRQMRPGDTVLYYHSVSEKRVVGVARVAGEARPDPTATEGDWSCIDLKPVGALARPVGLDVLKSDPGTQGLPLIRHTRLSLMPVTRSEFERILELGGGVSA